MNQWLSDFLNEFTPTLHIVLGAPIATLTPIITEEIRRHRRKREMKRGVLEELLALQYKMACVAHEIRARHLALSDKFFDEILLPVLENYRGPDRSEEALTIAKRERALQEPERAKSCQPALQPNAGLLLKQYTLPFLSTQIADLAICPFEFRQRVLHVSFRLDSFNQAVQYLRSLEDRTFTVRKEDKENYENVKGVLEFTYRACAVDAEIIVKAINRVMSQS